MSDYLKDLRAKTNHMPLLLPHSVVVLFNELGEVLLEERADDGYFDFPGGGIDLKEDLSRLCIICKVPYANLTDKWTKERMTLDPSWYTTAACINLIQMSGRSIRSSTDYANTYILDSDFGNLAMNAMEIFPDWWKESVVY